MKILVKFWYTKNPLLFLLLPFSHVYQLGFLLHKLSYRFGIKKRFCAPVPTVVVGNITVGGTGKTPFTIALVKTLIDHGYRPGIISRGYRSKAKKFPKQVFANSCAQEVGDEPILIAEQTGCPVVIAPKRKDAIELLLQSSDCNIIVSDDGLQHHAIKKDIEIIIVDGNRRFGNGWCLPAGPLRESLRKLTAANFIVYNDAPKEHTYSMVFEYGAIYNLINPELKLGATLRHDFVHAVAGIGNPNRFYTQLRLLGFKVIEHTFNDHHNFTANNLQFNDDRPIIMTEKDAVKCRSFAKENFWVLPVRAAINLKFINDFMDKLKATSR